MKDLKPAATAKLLGIPVEALNMEQTLQRIATELEECRKGYVCLVGVHGIMEAHRDPRLASTYASAAITVPDGAPTEWVGRWQGHHWMRRVAGPDLMLEVFRRKEFSGYSHFLYGGEEGVAARRWERLASRFPWTQILGTFTPPFRELNVDEKHSLIARVRELKPDIIWVGIGTPKQERFMQQYLRQLDAPLMFGVGAAFDFHAGRINDAPRWIKSSGLQWLHRLMQDPRRLWRRYLRNKPAFVWHIALQLTGLREYPSSRTETEKMVPSRAHDAPAQERIGSDRGIKRASHMPLTR